MPKIGEMIYGSSRVPQPGLVAEIIEDKETYWLVRDDWNHDIVPVRREANGQLYEVFFTCYGD